MRIVGKRELPPITLNASGEQLTAGCKFNDEMNAMFGSQDTGMKKGVIRFSNHEEANKHQFDCLVDAVTRTSLKLKSY